MKSITLILLVIILLSLHGCGNKADKNIKIITFNIRYDNPHDSINAWPNRSAIVCEFLKNEKPDLFGLQEALWYQYEAIDSALSGYSSVAVGRDDGKIKGEMNPVFYNNKRFMLVQENTFWLSSTPDIAGSKGWGASLPRIVTWVELKDKLTGKPVYYFNTHFAHDSDSARVMSAGIILKEVKRIAGRNHFAVTGDFNMSPESKAYSIITESASPGAFLRDSYVISGTKPEGPSYTTNSWSDKPGRSRIDYIFVAKGTRVLNHSTIIKKEGNVFISDHWPVETVISF
jgi:endonuclease/exonuclease/phosphatase family metal-dependent hydrolase